MSPTWFSDVPTPSPSSSHSPVPSFNLLLKAAQEEELKHKAPINIPLTPPQSPPKTLLGRAPYLSDLTCSGQTFGEFPSIHLELRVGL